jgi:DNA-binding phage protein
MAIKPTATTKQLLKAIRDAEKAGVTRYQISKLSGVSQGQLSRMMKLQQLPRLDTAERIAKALGMKLILISEKENAC